MGCCSSSLSSEETAGNPGATLDLPAKKNRNLKGMPWQKRKNKLGVPSMKSAIQSASEMTDFDMEDARHITVEDEYETIRLLGRGGSCEVTEVRHLKNNKKFALKILSKKEDSNVVLFWREVNCLQALIHQSHVVRLIDYFQDDSNWYIVTQLCVGGDLLSALVGNKTFSESKAITVLKTLVNTVLQMHKLGIVHRDIKPTNLMFDEHSNLILVDFGLAMRSDTDMYADNDLCGTTMFTPPEAIISVAGDGTGLMNYDLKTWDMWSIGVTAYVMLCGCYPFSGRNENKLFLQISNFYQIRWPRRQIKLSTQSRDWLSHLMVRDWKQRLTAEHALKHAFLSSSHPQTQTNEFGAMWSNSIGLICAENKLMHVIAADLVQKLKSEERKLLMSIFGDLDTDNSGYLERSEIIQWLRQSMPGLNDSAIQTRTDQIMSLMDKKKTGKIHLKGFMHGHASIQLVTAPEETLKTALGDIVSENSVNTAALKNRFETEITVNRRESMAPALAMVDVIERVSTGNLGDTVNLKEFATAFTTQLSSERSTVQQLQQRIASRSATATVTPVDNHNSDGGTVDTISPIAAAAATITDAPINIRRNTRMSTITADAINDILNDVVYTTADAITSVSDANNIANKSENSRDSSASLSSVNVETILRDLGCIDIPQK